VISDAVEAVLPQVRAPQVVLVLFDPGLLPRVFSHEVPLDDAFRSRAVRPGLHCLALEVTGVQPDSGGSQSSGLES